MGKLKARAPKYSALPAELKPFYVPVEEGKEDGPAQLDVEAVEGFELINPAAMRAELTTLKKDKQRADQRLAKLRKPESEDLWEPEEIAALIDEIATLKTKVGKGDDADVRRRLAEAEKKAKLYDTERPQWERKHGLARAKAQKAEVLAALGAAGVMPKYQQLMLRELLDATLVEETQEGDFVVRVKGDDGKARIGNGKDGFATVEDYAKGDLRTKFADFFAGDGASGAGAKNANNGQGSHGRFAMKSSEATKDVGKWTALQQQARAAGQTAVMVPD